jgi:excisionase family DNA binding protein
MNKQIILHETPIDDFREMISEIVSNAVSEQVSKEFERRNIREENEFKFLTCKETAQILGVTLPTLHLWTKEGNIQGSRIGTRVRYRMTDVEAALQTIETGKSKRSGL